MSQNILLDPHADYLKFLAYGATVGGSMAAMQLIKRRFDVDSNPDVPKTT